jgi:hypothetical protein
MEGGIHFLIRIKQGMKVNVGGKDVYANKNLEARFKKLVFENSTPQKIEAHIDSLIKNREVELGLTLLEGSCSTTEEFHEKARNHIKVLQELKSSLLNEFSL